MLRLLFLGLFASALLGAAAELAPAPRTVVLRPGPVTVAGTLHEGGLLELDVPISVLAQGGDGLTELAIEEAPAGLAGQHVQVRATLALGREPRLVRATYR